jgi:predicted nucleotidyltransferase
MMNDSEVRGSISRLLGATPEVQLAYLFGSRAQGAHAPTSDYDLAVLLADGSDGDSVLANVERTVRILVGGQDVDVVDLGRAPVELAYAVISAGVVLFERSVVTRVEYEANVMGRYGDYLPILRQFRQDILRGGERATRVQRYREALGRTQRTLGALTATFHQDTR